MTTAIRTRWAAIGAAVAVTLGAGGLGIAQATSDSGDGPVSAFFPIEPCRLAADASVAEDSSITLDGWGTTGACDLPDDITGLAANVTAVGATAQTNLRFYAQGDDVPETANLNPSPGAPPAPNAVNITLNDTNGQFNVYNRFGTVAVFIDIMGYYDNHTHDDRYYTEDEIDALMNPVIDVLRVNSFGFKPSAEGTNWDIGELWNHSTSGSPECIVAPISIAAGRSVSGIVLSYVASAAEVVEIGVYGIPNTSGSPAGDPFMLSETIPYDTSAPDTIDSLAAAFDADNVIPADIDLIAVICTAGNLSVAGFQVELD